MNETQPYDIQVHVKTTYLAHESDPRSDRYVFAYTITVENHGSLAAKLLTRHWIITDSDSRRQEVHGTGVVGEQPYLKPGDGFQYTSATMIDTPVGSMQGSYQMRAEDGAIFDAEIPPFSLSDVQTLH